ncbi:hypothetical protein UlMin_033603 [Ulmus minor]
MILGSFVGFDFISGLGISSRLKCKTLLKPLSTKISPFRNPSQLVPQLGCVQSQLPLHSVVSSAQLTSCMGIDSSSSRLLSQDFGKRYFWLHYCY